MRTLKIFINLFFESQRLNCCQIELQNPNSMGRARQGQPTRIRYRIAPTIIRRLGLS
ncbi:TPA: hypothetical protein KKX52_001222 [Legionella pneumophila]|nr:hypothetical protein LLB_2269 [Legionella longbeachae D-4968]UAK46939.1 hypothetical protein K8O86_01695 [Legionella longbeachae]HBD7397239.1 hypothetical protein [Legionella pneumophila]